MFVLQGDRERMFVSRRVYQCVCVLVWYIYARHSRPPVARPILYY